MKGIQDTSTENYSAIIGNNRKFVVPKFQRDYSWTNEQWDDLWQDIDSMISEDSDHYMGYLVLQTNDDKNFQIIDGQQRFTTISILILSVIKVLNDFIEKDIEAEDNKKRASYLIHTYIGNIDPISLEYDNILTLNRNNNPYYKDYIVKLGDLKLRNTTVTEKLMRKAFDFFYEKINKKCKSGQELAVFIQKVVDNLFFTVIKVNDDLNAFRVFETLNARGVQLSSSDLLKNYLFSLVDANSSHIDRINVLEEKWSNLTKNVKTEKLPDFIRYYWNSTHKLIRANELFKTIRKNITEESQVYTFVNDLLASSDVYMALTNGNDELWGGDDDICENIELLNIFSIKQHSSVLMAAWRCLKLEEFKKTLHAIVIICFRYSIIGDKNPNEIERVFNDIAIKISQTKSFDVHWFQKVYVEDAEFHSAFKSKTFTVSSRNTKVVKYILSKLEYAYGNTAVVDYCDERNSVEHILPQNPSDAWGLDKDTADRLFIRLGNLCLLEYRKNDDLGNLVYDQKKEIYKSSSFIMARNVADTFQQWNEKSINTRQSDMANKAKSIWSISF